MSQYDYPLGLGQVEPRGWIEATNGRLVTRKTISNQGNLDKGVSGYIRKGLFSRFRFFSPSLPFSVSPL